MAVKRMTNIAVLLCLLFAGFTSAFIIWILVLIPLRMVKPFEFQPAELNEEIFDSVQNKISMFKGPGKSTVLTKQEVCALLKGAIEEKLGFEIAAIYVQFNQDEITALFKSKITDIPASGFLSYITKKKETEHTTTLISAIVKAQEGKVVYSIVDFRIGRVKIPIFLISRFREGKRAIPGIYIKKLELFQDTLHVERL